MVSHRSDPSVLLGAIHRADHDSSSALLPFQHLKKHHSILTRVETQPPSLLKLSQLRKAFRVRAHVLWRGATLRTCHRRRCHQAPSWNSNARSCEGGSRRRKHCLKMSARKKKVVEGAKVKRWSASKRSGQKCRVADGRGRPLAQTSSGAAETQSGDLTQESSGTVGGFCAEHWWAG